MTSVCAHLMQRDRVLDRGWRGSYMFRLFCYFLIFFLFNFHFKDHLLSCKTNKYQIQRDRGDLICSGSFVIFKFSFYIHFKEVTYNLLLNLHISNAIWHLLVQRNFTGGGGNFIQVLGSFAIPYFLSPLFQPAICLVSGRFSEKGILKALHLHRCKSLLQNVNID